MLCPNCGHEQSEGKFCEKCGTEMQVVSEATESVATSEPVQEESVEGSVTVEAEHAQPVQPTQQQQPQQAAQPVQPAQPNENVEQVKEKAKVYYSYFLNNLKRPSTALRQGENEFVNGIISVILLVVLMNLAIYMGVSEVTYYIDGFLSYFISLALFMFVAIGVAILAIFITNKFFGTDKSFKTIVSIYGAHLSPALLVSVVSFLLLLLKSYRFGALSLTLILSFTLILLPLYLIINLLINQSRSIDPLYGVLVFIVILWILNGITFFIFADSYIGSIISDIGYLFDIF